MHVHAGKPALTLQKQACVHVAVHEQTEKHGIWIKQWAWNKRLRLQGGRVYGTERDKGDSEGKSSPGSWAAGEKLWPQMFSAARLEAGHGYATSCMSCGKCRT